MQKALSRELLGEEIIQKMRFPVIRKEVFIDVVIQSNILTKEEEFNITEYLSSPGNAQVHFPTMPRMYVKRSQRNYGQ